MKEKITAIKNEMEKKLEKYCVHVVKSYFGNEYTFYTNETNQFCDMALSFLKKYDPSYFKFFKNTYAGRMLIPGVHVSKIDNRTFLYVRIGHSDDDKILKDFEMDDIYIYIFGKHMMKYSHILEKIMTTNNTTDDIFIYSIDGVNRDEQLNITRFDLMSRDESTIYFANNELKMIINHLDRFNAQESFYNEKQILYKTGLLFYGKPGTGKSSLTKVLATKYHRSIISINLSKIGEIDFSEVTSGINYDTSDRYIVLFEDIDTLFLNRDKTATREDKSIINKLLQFLDSNSSPNNVIFIATTNHIELLDDALLREGRFDLKIEVKELDRKTAYKFGESFNLDKETMDEILNNLVKELNLDEKKNPCCFNQSKLQSHMLARINNYSLEKAKYLYEEVE